MARELHDSVIQILSSVKFRLQAIEEKVAASDEGTWRDTLKAKAALEKAIGEVRRISRNLRPSELDDLGLAPALRSLCAEFGERTGMAVNLSLNRLPKAIPDDIELNLYRIIQEALGNIEKHSRATKVSLRLARQASKLCAAIADNGCGFDPIAPRPRRTAKGGGMGLVDMRERAALLGGHCQLRSMPGSGTEIVVEMPLRNNETSKHKTTGEKG
ncbi:MAG: sensor histidine kinase [Verrucomicrobia bacterium]|nr:sensor histidine kinase [Verrucomicrobiota bacterium]